MDGDAVAGDSVDEMFVGEVPSREDAAGCWIDGEIAPSWTDRRLTRGGTGGRVAAGRSRTAAYATTEPGRHDPRRWIEAERGDARQDAVERGKICRHGQAVPVAQSV